jgi:hypothetical protein
MQQMKVYLPKAEVRLGQMDVAFDERLVEAQHLVTIAVVAKVSTTVAT